MRSVGERRGFVLPSALAASKRFGRYKPEIEGAIRTKEVKEDEILNKLNEAWTKYGRESYPSPSDIDGLIKDFEYSSSDIGKFCIALLEYKNQREFNMGLEFSWKAGNFLDKLVEYCRDTKFIINTRNFEVPINASFNYNKKKNIVIDGNVGKDLGAVMESGSITINGNVGGQVGHAMRGGKITVNGNVGDGIGQTMRGGKIIMNGNVGCHHSKYRMYSSFRPTDEEYVGAYMERGIIIVNESKMTFAGLNMKGGKIIVNGDAGGLGAWMKGGIITVNGDANHLVGNRMEGGELHIEGKIKGVAKTMKGGKIFHKGQLIVEK